MLSFLSRVLVIALGRILGDVILYVIARTDFGMNYLIKWSTDYSKKIMKQSELFD